MKKPLQRGNIKTATFIGLYIQEFLLIENLIENTIIKFFQKRKLPAAPPVLGAHIADNINSEIDRQNSNINLLLSHMILPNRSFPVNLKIECFEEIIKINSPKAYNKNFIELLNSMMTLRNQLAHNISTFKNGSIIAAKMKTKFVKRNESLTDELIPVMDVFDITNKIQTEIFEQFTVAKVFIFLYNEYHLNISASTEYKEAYLNALVNITSSPYYNSKYYGVFQALRTSEQRESIKKEQSVKYKKSKNRLNQIANKKPNGN